MDRLAVESSSLSSVGYEESSRTLEVEFASRAVYRYLGVPSEVFAALLATDSKGACLNRDIKGQYPYVRVRGQRSRVK